MHDDEKAEDDKKKPNELIPPVTPGYIEQSDANDEEQKRQGTEPHTYPPPTIYTPSLNRLYKRWGQSLGKLETLIQIAVLIVVGLYTCYAKRTVDEMQIANERSRESDVRQTLADRRSQHQYAEAIAQAKVTQDAVKEEAVALKGLFNSSRVQIDIARKSLELPNRAWIWEDGPAPGNSELSDANLPFNFSREYSNKGRFPARNVIMKISASFPKIGWNGLKVSPDGYVDAYSITADESQYAFIQIGPMLGPIIILPGPDKTEVVVFDDTPEFRATMKRVLDGQCIFIIKTDCTYSDDVGPHRSKWTVYYNKRLKAWADYDGDKFNSAD